MAWHIPHLLDSDTSDTHGTSKPVDCRAAHLQGSHGISKYKMVSHLVEMLYAFHCSVKYVPAEVVLLLWLVVLRLLIGEHEASTVKKQSIHMKMHLPGI
jgi:hypothetical protein